MKTVFRKYYLIKNRDNLTLLKTILKLYHKIDILIHLKNIFADDKITNLIFLLLLEFFLNV